VRKSKDNRRAPFSLPIRVPKLFPGNRSSPFRLTGRPFDCWSVHNTDAKNAFFPTKKIASPPFIRYGGGKKIFVKKKFIQSFFFRLPRSLATTKEAN
jgi:hypothetical protein